MRYAVFQRGIETAQFECIFDGVGGALCGFLTFFQEGTACTFKFRRAKNQVFGAFEAYNDISSLGGERDTRNQNRFTQIPSSPPRNAAANCEMFVSKTAKNNGSITESELTKKNSKNIVRKYAEP